MAEIAPSVLSADFTRLGEHLAQVEEAGASIIHVDVMDGHFVPNITIGPFIVNWIRQATRLPIEVVPFGWTTHLEAIKSLGGRALVRRDKNGVVFMTDGGHYIIDAAFGKGIAKPRELDAELKARPGVVETGLFLEMTTAVIVAGPNSVGMRERPE